MQQSSHSHLIGWVNYHSNMTWAISILVIHLIQKNWLKTQTGNLACCLSEFMQYAYLRFNLFSASFILDAGWESTLESKTSWKPSSCRGPCGGRSRQMLWLIRGEFFARHQMWQNYGRSGLVLFEENLIWFIINCDIKCDTWNSNICFLIVLDR